MISNKNFNEPHELFDNLRAFFLSRYSHINLSIYRFDKTDGSLEFYLGDAYSNAKKIHLKRLDAKDYVNERAALNTGRFECNITLEGFGGKGAVKIDEYILSFGTRDEHFEKNIRDIHAVFSVGLSELIRSKLMIIKEKYTDPRTGLYNPKFVQEVGSKKPYSIVRIDINDFKVLNDTHGHDAGDTVLEDLGKILGSSVRPDDKACRDGGDEFILLIDSSEMLAIEKIIERVHALMDIRNEKSKYPVDVSIGYCLYDAGKTFAERVKIADEQMYSQKTERSHVYRLAKKISLIQDPENLKELMDQIQKTLEEKSKQAA